MRKYCLFFFLCLPCLGSWDFKLSETDYVDVTDNSVLDLPDANWTISGWFKHESNTGSSLRSMVYLGDAAPYWCVYQNETSLATHGDKLDVQFKDTGGSFNRGYSDVLSPVTGQWYNIIVTRDGTTFRCYIDNAIQSSFTFTDVLIDDITLDADSEFGARNLTGTPDLYYDGKLAEFAKWDRLITADERADLQTLYPNAISRTSLSWYIPMYDDFNSDVGGLTITNQGAAADTGDHPSLSAGGSLITKITSQSRRRR